MCIRDRLLASSDESYVVFGHQLDTIYNIFVNILRLFCQVQNSEIYCHHQDLPIYSNAKIINTRIIKVNIYKIL